MKTEEQINNKINEIAKQAIGTEGSKAYRLRGQIEILAWTIEEE